MAWARAVVAAAVSVGITDALSLVQQKPSVTDDLDDLDHKCQDPGQLLFMHVQNSGGSSVEKFLGCKAKRNQAGFKLHLGEDPKKDYSLGEDKCTTPTVCASKGRYVDRTTHCGQEFHAPKAFTVMRDPVERVFSFYNQAKFENHNKASKFVFPEIDQMLWDCVNGKKAGREPIDDMCKGMVNHMTFHTFAKSDHPYDHPYTHGASQELIKAAKSTMANLNAIFFMDDLTASKFPTLFERTGLLNSAHETEKDHKCKMEHEKWTHCPREVCKSKPTAEEREAIEQYNNMDMALYEYARFAKNRVHR